MAGAVLLAGINTQLPEASYTTAIEYGFYVFFGLCLFCMVVSLVVERLHHFNVDKIPYRVELLARATYVLVVVFMLVVYGVKFGDRLL